MANTGSPRRSALYQILQPSTGKGNTVIVWNTVYRTAVMEQLKQKGYPIYERDLAHVWPTRYAYSNVYGKYHFKVEEVRERKGLRQLRQPEQRA
jgi:Tn3 transposase DDE domain